MRKEYDLSKLTVRRNPYATTLKENVKIDILNRLKKLEQDHNIQIFFLQLTTAYSGAGGTLEL